MQRDSAFWDLYTCTVRRRASDGSEILRDAAQLGLFHVVLHRLAPCGGVSCLECLIYGFMLFKYGLEAFRSAGLLHLAPTFVKCKYWFTGLTLTHRYKIGTFEAGKEEEQRFVGTVDFTIPSGNPSYLGGNRVRIGGTPEDLYGPEWSDSRYAGNASQFVWFYWPNNSDGGPYPWAEGAGIGVIKQE